MVQALEVYLWLLKTDWGIIKGCGMLVDGLCKICSSAGKREQMRNGEVNRKSDLKREIWLFLLRWGFSRVHCLAILCRRAG